MSGIGTSSEVWQATIALLDGNPNDSFNITWETLGRHAQSRRADLPAFIFVDESGRHEWSFAEILDLSLRFSSVLKSIGVKKGDRVGGVFGQSIEPWICAFGTWHAGAIYVPLFAGFGQDAFQQRLSAASCKIVVYDPGESSTITSVLTEEMIVLEVAGRKAEEERSVDVGDNFWELIDEAQPDADPPETLGSETATLMFTSGTTGTPKACRIHHAGLVSLIPFGRSVLATGEGSRLFAGSAASWSYGLFTTGVVPLFLGATRISRRGRFDPIKWWSVIREEAATHIAAAPTALRVLLPHAPKSDELALGWATTAGEALEASLIDRWRSHFGFAIQDGYGLTEVGMAIGVHAADRDAAIPGAMGDSVPGFTVELHREDGTRPSTNEPGEIVVRSPFLLASGYEGAEDVWRSRIDANGWFRTGDVASRNEADELFYSGRKDDLIVTAGYNVDPFEIEAVILSQAVVREAAVVAGPDDQRGDVVRACIVLATLDIDRCKVAEEIRDLVTKRVGVHAYPRQFIFLDQLPRTETGKVLRRQLRELEASNGAH